MKVVYEDNHVIIVAKESGEIVQGDKTGISGTVLTDHFSRQMKMKQKSIQTISKCWTSENDRENRPRESTSFFCLYELFRLGLAGGYLLH